MTEPGAAAEPGPQPPPDPPRSAPPAPPPELDRPQIAAPDPDAARAARELVDADPRLGRLGAFVVWAAGVQGNRRPLPFTAPVALVVAGRHEAARFAGRHDAGEVDRRVAALRSGPGPVGVPVRVLDLGEEFAPAGPIATADALEAAATVRAYGSGRRAVDREVDGGADLLIVGDVDADDGPAVAALVAVLTDREPVACVRRGGDAAVWMRTVQAVRDARRRGQPHRADVLGLLTAVGGADLAALTGALVTAAARRTPVLLDGVAATAAGLLAERHAPGCARWWAAAGRTGEPAHGFALDWLDLTPLLELDLGYDGAAGGLLALPLLQAALAAVG